MKMKRILACALSLVLAACVCFVQPSLASVFTFETQYDYKEADPAWLTDLVIKEDVSDVTNVVGTTLVAAPSYPYTATAESFKTEVDQFCSLYSFNEDSFKISFLYFIELLGSNSSLYAAQVSDEEVKAYLRDAGIAYPDNASSDMNVLAKALYTAMVTGAFKSLTAEEGAAGVQLEKALTSFVIQISGFSEAELRSWIPGGGLESIDDYVLAVSRMTLWSNGYDVTVDTPEDEVYKLLAVMSLRSMGISVDADASFAELQSKITAAMLGKKYGVTVNPLVLSSELADGTAAYYILQLIGQKNGLSLRADSMTYEEAFDFVASHTDLFDIEEGEFYADIYAYDIYLTAPRSSLWVYPTSYYGGISSSAVRITCNGILLKDNYFTQVMISAAEKVQKLTITVNCTAGAGSVKEYVITVHSEDAIERQENTVPETPVDETKTFLSSNAIVSGILSSVGVNSGIAEAAGNLLNLLPQNVQSAMSFISPTFGGDRSGSENTAQLPISEETKSNAQSFIRVLDSIGAFMNVAIGGIEGIDLSENFSAATFDFNYVTFR